MKEYNAVLDCEVDLKAVEKINYTFAKTHQLIPIRMKNNTLYVAMADPFHIVAVDNLRHMTGMDIEVLTFSIEEIESVIDLYYEKQQVEAAAQLFKENTENTSYVSQEKVENNYIDEAPIVKMVNGILKQGFRLEASDIHIEPFKDSLRIRYRINGTLKTVMDYDVEFLPAIATRIKVIANLDISEQRKPQDGKIILPVKEELKELRVSIIPTIHGEKIVLRLTAKSIIYEDIQGLGFLRKDLAIFKKMIKKPNGILLATGPTGCGKSTTLYAALHQLNQETTNIVTIEDPVEADIKGINQMQVNPKAGLEFASALRYVLRQDPDIIMVGEIRDKETAQLSIKAALTGHLVLSTLHTNDAISTVVRLLDMGIDPFLIGSTLLGVISQRLVRKLCPKCKSTYLPSKEEMKFLNISESILLFRSEGCSYCNFLGYQGRTGLYEILFISPSIRQMIYQNQSPHQLTEQALKEGMTPLFYHGCNLVLTGHTTIEELLRITYSVDEKNLYERR
ncbi:MAG: type II/IV secretion system protein [Epulopiscium sp.]|nr:type II/IV secretion system protein [Candidatus Epulonipiscium sp.]